MTNDFGTAAVFRGSHEQKIININHWQFFSKTLDVCQSIPWNHPSWFSHMWLLIMPDLFRRNIIYVLIPKIKCKKWICVLAIVYPHITMLIIWGLFPTESQQLFSHVQSAKVFLFCCLFPKLKNICWPGRRQVDMNSLRGDIITNVQKGPIIGHMIIQPICTDHKDSVKETCSWF